MHRTYSSDSPLVRHLLTTWSPAWQLSRFIHLLSLDYKQFYYIIFLVRIRKLCITILNINGVLLNSKLDANILQLSLIVRLCPWMIDSPITNFKKMYKTYRIDISLRLHKNIDMSGLPAVNFTVDLVTLDGMKL